MTCCGYGYVDKEGERRDVRGTRRERGETKGGQGGGEVRLKGDKEGERGETCLYKEHLYCKSANF